jgi:hypothetical protein
MLEKVLLAGVLTEGGCLRSGFLYFEEVPRLEFTFELVDATNADRFGAIRVPFVARRG